MRTVACIGSRALRREELDLCFEIGRYLVMNGFVVKTGNAVGADQAYAKGANSVDPTKVIIYLPWNTYNTEALVNGNRVVKVIDPLWFDIASQFHPVWDTLKQGARRLHARNVGIVDGVDFVIAYPNEGLGGGTVMGMRIAASKNILVYNLRAGDDEHWREIVGLKKSL